MIEDEYQKLVKERNKNCEMCNAKEGCPIRKEDEIRMDTSVEFDLSPQKPSKSHWQWKLLKILVFAYFALCVWLVIVLR